MCATYASEKSLEKIERFYGARQLPQKTNFHFDREMFPGRSGLYLFHRNNEILYTSGFWSLQYRFKRTPEITTEYATFNARSETVDSKETFKYPWNEGLRCVIPLNFFCEWRGEKGKKEKLAIRPQDQDTFTVAGIYEVKGHGVHSFTMLTCEPSEQMAKVHNRMPVILTDWKSWLDPKTTPAQAKEMCVPYPGLLQATKIK
ncbi:SOS response-associated peptidase [Bdellovibrio bacteriovorus]|uniref:SOS response-associated peptidase n=1 Tax=Bdellovibrio bacteriovorus TaxID=959 RepID=UPI0035A601D1